MEGLVDPAFHPSGVGKIGTRTSEDNGRLRLQVVNAFLQVTTCIYKLQLVFTNYNLYLQITTCIYNLQLVFTNYNLYLRITSCNYKSPLVNIFYML